MSTQQLQDQLNTLQSEVDGLKRISELPNRVTADGTEKIAVDVLGTEYKMDASVFFGDGGKTVDGDYTLQEKDRGLNIYITGAARTLTIPASLGWARTNECKVMFEQAGFTIDDTAVNVTYPQALQDVDGSSCVITKTGTTSGTDDYIVTQIGLEGVSTVTQEAYSTTLTFSGSKSSTFGSTDNSHTQAAAITFTYDLSGAVEGAIRTLEVLSNGDTITFPNTGTRIVENNSSTLLTIANNVITPENGKNYFFNFWYTNGNVNVIVTDATIYAPDFTPPTFSVAPASTNISNTSFDITATLNENGTVYAVVVADAATAPTSTEVKAGTGSGGSGELAAGNDADTGTGVTISLTGLTASTDYDTYVVAEDALGNLQASPTLVNVTTLTPFANTHSIVINANGEGDQTTQTGLIPASGGSDAAQTYEVWWKSTNDKASIIVNLSDDNFANKVVIATGGTNQYLYYLKQSSSGNQVVWNSVTNPIKIVDGWNKLVVVDDGLNTASSVKLYKNGADIFDNFATNGTYAGLSPVGTNESILLPRSNNASVYGDGKMNYYRQFNAALTPSEVALLGSTTPAQLTAGLAAKCILEKAFNNNHDSLIGNNGVAVGTPTFDTDLPV